MTIFLCIGTRRCAFVTSCTRCCGPNASEADMCTTDSLPSLSAILFTIATSLAARPLHVERLTGGHTLLDPVLVPIRRLVLQDHWGSSPDRQPELEASIPCRRSLISNISWPPGRHLRSCHSKRSCRSIPTTSATRSRRLSFNTDPELRHQQNLQHYSGDRACLSRRCRDQLLAVRDGGHGHRRGGGDYNPRPGATASTSSATS